MASPLDLYSFVSGEYDAGRKQRDGNRLKALYQQALSDPSQNQRAIIGQVAGIDPTQAKGLYDLLNSRAEDQRKAVGQRAAMVRALPQDQRQAAYEGIRPDLDAAGLFAPEGADEGYLGAVASMYGGLTAPQDSTPAAIRELQMLQANPELAALDMKRRTAGFDRPQLQIDQQGRPWFLSPGKPPTPAFGGQGAPTQVNYQTDDGQPIPADEQAALMQAIQAAARGEDFTIPVANGGDLSKIPPLSNYIGGGPRFGKAPEQRQQTDIERRLQMARQMGATPEELKRMVVGGDSGRDAQRISTADATKARQKMTQIQSARQQLNAVKQAFQKLRGSFSAGIGGNYLPTPEGQAFDRAIRNLSPLITAVTRVPGVGAMSDYEAKLQEASLPSRGTYEAVTEQQIADLERLLNTIEGGYGDLIGSKPQQAPAGEGWSIQKLGD